MFETYFPLNLQMLGSNLKWQIVAKVFFAIKEFHTKNRALIFARHELPGDLLPRWAWPAWLLHAFYQAGCGTREGSGCRSWDLNSLKFDSLLWVRLGIEEKKSDGVNKFDERTTAGFCLVQGLSPCPFLFVDRGRIWWCTTWIGSAGFGMHGIPWYVRGVLFKSCSIWIPSIQQGGVYLVCGFSPDSHHGHGDFAWHHLKGVTQTRGMLVAKESNAAHPALVGQLVM